VFTVEQIILSLVANAIGLCCILLLKAAPPRLVLYVCLVSMVAILVPWASLAKQFEVIVPVTNFIVADVLTLGVNHSAEISSEAQSASISAKVLWLIIGFSWIVATVWRAVRKTTEWRKIASDGDELTRFTHPGLARALQRTKFRRLPDSAMVATTGLWLNEVWIGERVGTDAQLEVALTHELCHIAYHDQYMLFLIIIIERLLWWNPLVWLLGKHARRSMEYACDSRCSSLLGEHKYRQSLAELFLVDYTPSTALELSVRTKSDVIKRMEYLEMNPKLKLRHLLVLFCASFVLAAVGATAASESSSESVPTLVGCHEYLPEGVQYEFRVISDIDTREGQSSELKVNLLDASNPESKEWPVDAERFLKCVQGVLGIGDDEGWPGT